MKNFILLFTITLLSINVFSADIYWIGSSGMWNDTTKWSYNNLTTCNCLPDTIDAVKIEINVVVTIPNGFNAISESIYTINQGSLTVQPSASYTSLNALVRGISITGILTNNGTINIDSFERTGIYSNVRIINNGTINILQTGGSGQAYSGGISMVQGTFNNNSGGIINISRIGSGLIGAGMSTWPSTTQSVEFNNYGIINIDGNFESGVYTRGGNINNYNTININGTERGMRLIGNNSAPYIPANFVNDTLGLIKITNLSSGNKFTGIYIFETNPSIITLTNYGSVNVASGFNYGLYLTSGLFENLGNVSIDGPLTGFFITKFTSLNGIIKGEFINKTLASCSILNTTSIGLYLESDAIFEVDSASTFTIDIASGGVAEIYNDATIDFDFDIRP